MDKINDGPRCNTRNYSDQRGNQKLYRSHMPPPIRVWMFITGRSTRFLCGASGCHPRMASITKKPNTYATAINQPSRSQRTTDFASGYMLEIATPADDPNQTIEPPKPTQ